MNALEELCGAYSQGRLCLFVGAGVSMGCGLLGWKDLAREVIRNLPPDPGQPSQISWITRQKALEPREPLEAMRYVRQLLGKKFKTAVAKCLYRPTINTSETVRAIAAMRMVLRICCFNYDDVLETAFEKEGRGFTIVVEGDEIPFVSDATLIFHTHGYLPRRRRSHHHPSQEIVFSEEDYHELYSSPYSWSNLIQLALLLNYKVLYVGCSLTDPNQRRILDLVAKMRPAHRHYALLKDPVRPRPPEDQPDRLKNWVWMSRFYEAEKKVRESDLASRGVIPIWWTKDSEIAVMLRDIARDIA